MMPFFLNLTILINSFDILTSIIHITCFHYSNTIVLAICESILKLFFIVIYLSTCLVMTNYSYSFILCIFSYPFIIKLRMWFIKSKTLTLASTANLTISSGSDASGGMTPSTVSGLSAVCLNE